MAFDLSRIHILYRIHILLSTCEKQQFASNLRLLVIGYCEHNEPVSYTHLIVS